MKVKIKKKNPSFKLVDFNIYNDKTYNDETEKYDYQFTIQMFAMNEKGENASIFINDFKPFFYIKVSHRIRKNTERAKEEIIEFIKNRCEVKYSIIDDCKLVKRKDLYGFDNNKDYYFLYLSFTTLTAYNKVKRLWINKDNKNATIQIIGK